MTIDHDAGEPVWRQLAGIIRDQITQGEFEPGKRIPSVRTIAQTCGVADSTVKKSLALLKDAGLVGSVMGRGWYVL